MLDWLELDLILVPNVPVAPKASLWEECHIGPPGSSKSNGIRLKSNPKNPQCPTSGNHQCHCNQSGGGFLVLLRFPRVCTRGYSRLIPSGFKPFHLNQRLSAKSASSVFHSLASWGCGVRFTDLPGTAVPGEFAEAERCPAAGT